MSSEQRGKYKGLLWARCTPPLAEQFARKAEKEGSSVSTLMRDLALAYVLGDTELKKGVALARELRETIYSASATVGM